MSKVSRSFRYQPRDGSSYSIWLYQREEHQIDDGNKEFIAGIEYYDTDGKLATHHREQFTSLEVAHSYFDTEVDNVLTKCNLFDIR